MFFFLEPWWRLLSVTVMVTWHSRGSAEGIPVSLVLSPEPVMPLVQGHGRLRTAGLIFSPPVPVEGKFSAVML